MLKKSPSKSWLLGVLLLGMCGCANFVDQVTDRQFKLKDLWTKPPDPLTVLRDSTDGAKRGQAYASLKEPLRNGGTQEQQELYINMLITAATKNPPPKGNDPRNPYPQGVHPDCLEPLVRLGAIRALADYKDPRAAKALRDVYYGISEPGTLAAPRSGSLPFLPDVNTKIKMQALAALEKSGSPIARDVFVQVIQSAGPGKKGAQEDINQTNDERLAALRGLAHFHDYEVLNTLVNVMGDRNENIALRDRAYVSLKTITGKNLPLDAVAWRNLIQNAPPNAFAHEPSTMQRFLNFMGH